MSTEGIADAQPITQGWSTGILETDGLAEVRVGEWPCLSLLWPVDSWELPAWLDQTHSSHTRIS